MPSISTPPRVHYPEAYRKERPALSPCPFCGHGAPRFDQGCFHWFVHCPACLGRGPEDVELHKAAERWNEAARRDSYTIHPAYRYFHSTRRLRGGGEEKVEYQLSTLHGPSFVRRAGGGAWEACHVPLYSFVSEVSGRIAGSHLPQVEEFFPSGPPA